MPESQPVVLVVDDDISVRESLELLLRNKSLDVETFVSAQELLNCPPKTVPSCLLLDISLPGLNGLDLQKRLAVERYEMPIIFITGHGDIPKSVQAMKAGAVEFLTKPFSDEILLNAVRNALIRSRALLERSAEIRALKARYSCLTARERDVMALVVIGLPNKQVGGELGISEITVKAHRGSLMRKMKAESLACRAALDRLCPRLDKPRAETSCVTRLSSPRGPIAPPRRYRSIPLSHIAQVYITVLVTSLVACRSHWRLKRHHRRGLFSAGVNRGSSAQSWAPSPDTFDA
jgi:FixJ family two-component response regulator